MYRIHPPSGQPDETSPGPTWNRVSRSRPLLVLWGLKGYWFPRRPFSDSISSSSPTTWRAQVHSASGAAQTFLST